MSRPVGTYYASSESKSGGPFAPAPSSSDWDWGSTTTATAVPAASASSTIGMTTTTGAGNDWYGSGGGGGGGSSSSAPATTLNTNMAAAAGPGPYTSSGFGNSNKSSNNYNVNSTNISTAAVGGGFASQPMQLQQQPVGSSFFQQQSNNDNTMFMQQEQQQPLLSGAMDSSAMNMGMNTPQGPSGGGGSVDGGGGPSFSMFMPNVAAQQQSASMTTPTVNFDDEPPLLEELGINLSHILVKTKAVVLPFSRFGGDRLDPATIVKDADLAGPVALALALGGEMVLTGKLQFGYIYGFGLFGCCAMTTVVNLMSPDATTISFWTVTSILGYSLLPVNVLALIKIFIINVGNLQTLGRILGLVTVAWSTLASTRLLEMGCNLREQRYLLAYPIALLYSAFVLMTIF